MQINNLKIKYNSFYEKWQVITLYKTVLEEFETEEAAKNWATETKDFINKTK